MPNERTLSFCLFILIINSLWVKSNYEFEKDYTHQKSILRKLSEEIIAEKTGYHFKNRVYIEIGSPPQKFKLKLSSSFCGIWVHNKKYFENGFDSTLSSTYSRNEGSVLMENVSGVVSHDKMDFINYNIDSMPFLLVDLDSKEDNVNYQGMIGLGYRCSYEQYFSFELMRFITVNSAPIKNVFFVRLSQESGGYIELGDLPSKIDYNYEKYKTMKVIQEYRTPSWIVKLDSVYFDNDMILIKDNLSIGLSGAFFSVKKDFFSKIKDKYFKNYIEKGLCKFKNREVYEITCDLSSKPDIGMISLIVGKWNLKIDGKSLFVKLEREEGMVQWFGIVYYSEFDKYYISQALFRDRTFVYDKINNEIGYFHTMG